MTRRSTAATPPAGDPEAAARAASDSATGRPARRRRWPWVVLALALLVLAAVAWLARLLEPERLSALLLRQAEQRSSLTLSVAEPAQVSFWPDLHISLRGLRASVPGHASPMLTVAAVELVLPWSALLQREARIRALRLRQPVLDRRLLAVWLQSRPPGDGGASQLPELTANLVVIDGSVVDSGQGQAWQLHEVALETSELLPARPFAASASGRVQLGEAGLVGAIQIETVPTSAEGALVLEPLRLRLLDSEGELLAEAAGSVRMGPDDALSLSLQVSPLRLPQAVLAWLPAPADAAPAKLAISYAGSTSLDGSMQLDLRHAGASATLAGTPTALLEWWNADAAAPLPPATGTLDAPSLQLPGMQLEGVRLQLQEATTDPAAASAANAANAGEAASDGPAQ